MCEARNTKLTKSLSQQPRDYKVCISKFLWEINQYLKIGISKDFILNMFSLTKFQWCKNIGWMGVIEMKYEHMSSLASIWSYSTPYAGLTIFTCSNPGIVLIIGSCTSSGILHEIPFGYITSSKGKNSASLFVWIDDAIWTWIVSFGFQPDVMALLLRKTSDFGFEGGTISRAWRKLRGNILMAK